METSVRGLAVRLGPLIGREREVGAVTALLGDGQARLVTLTGPGGVGKTSLALRVVEEVEARFVDGSVCVGLAAVTDPAFVTPTIAQALGVREEGGLPVVERLVAVLRDQQRLLVLDNFEQVVDAATIVAALLAACRRLSVLVTSRVRLNLADEYVYPLGPLELPRTGQTVASEVAGSAAVQVFVERARRVQPGFALDAANAEVVAAICRRLDGLPLAIELAAARVALLDPRQLLARLERALPLLTGGARDAPSRQRTMRNAVTWSYDLLSHEEQVLFRRLSVFAGSFELAAAEEVAGGSPVGDVFAGIASLAEQNLLRPVVADGGEPRFAMLEIVREFGLELLDASGEAPVVRSVHAVWVLKLAAPMSLFREPNRHLETLDILERELPNVRAALGWLIAEDPPAATGLAALLGWFWVLRGHMNEGIRWSERVLTRDTVPSRARGEVLALGGMVHAEMGNAVVADAWLSEARRIATELDDTRLVATAAYYSGIADGYAGDDTTANQHFELSLALARQLGHAFLVGGSLTNLGDAALRVGKLEVARERTTEAVAWLDRVGETHLSGMAHGTLGWIALEARDLAAARRHAAASLASGVAIADPWSIGDALVLVAGVALASSSSSPQGVARLLGAALTHRERVGSRIFFHHEQHAGVVAQLHAKLGDPALEEAIDEGRRMSPDDVLAEAWTVVRREAAEPAAVRSAGPLSPREREVLALIARGLADKEVAAALRISRRTVTTHVTSILGKLGVESRSAAVARAVRDGMC